MATKTEKRVFPAIKGVEVSIKYINKYGNKVAVNIGDKGYPIENNPDMTDDLKVKIMKNIHIGQLVVREVEVKTKKTDENKMFIEEFEQLIGGKKVSESTNNEPKPVETPKKSTTTVVKKTTSSSTTDKQQKTESHQPPTKKKDK